MFKNLFPKKYVPTGEPQYKYYAEKNRTYHSRISLFHVFVDSSGKRHTFRVRTIVSENSYDVRLALRSRGYITKEEYIISTL